MRGKFFCGFCGLNPICEKFTMQISHTHTHPSPDTVVYVEGAIIRYSAKAIDSLIHQTCIVVLEVIDDTLNGTVVVDRLETDVTESDNVWRSPFSGRVAHVHRTDIVLEVVYLEGGRGGGEEEMFVCYNSKHNHTMISYVPSKRPWALGIHEPKIKSGRLHREVICIYITYLHEPYDHQKWGVGTYTVQIDER